MVLEPRPPEPETPFRMSIPCALWARGAGPGGSSLDKAARVARLATNDAPNSLAPPVPAPRRRALPAHTCALGRRGRGCGGRASGETLGPRAHPTPARRGGPNPPGLSELISLHAYGWYRRLNALAGSRPDPGEACRKKRLLFPARSLTASPAAGRSAGV